MVVPLFATGFVLLLLIVGLFVTVTKSRGMRSEQERRAGLGLMAILGGPVVGASLAWLGDTLGDVHPADVRFNYVLLSSLGGVAGVMAGVAFAITGLFSPHDSGGQDLPDKPVADVTDDL